MSTKDEILDSLKEFNIGSVRAFHTQVTATEKEVRAVIEELCNREGDWKRSVPTVLICKSSQPDSTYEFYRHRTAYSLIDFTRCAHFPEVIYTHPGGGVLRLGQLPPSPDLLQYVEQALLE